jgi:hypothetical protein
VSAPVCVSASVCVCTLVGVSMFVCAYMLLYSVTAANCSLRSKSSRVLKCPRVGSRVGPNRSNCCIKVKNMASSLAHRGFIIALGGTVVGLLVLCVGSLFACSDGFTCAFVWVLPIFVCVVTVVWVDALDSCCKESSLCMSMSRWTFIAFELCAWETELLSVCACECSLGAPRGECVCACLCSCVCE